MALKEYIGLSRLTQAFSLLKSKIDGKLGDFATTSDVTISGVTYHTYWEVAPTASNQVFGVAVHPTNGKLTRIYNNKGTYTAVSYDANTTTGDGIKTKVEKTGTAQSAITSTISASTTLDNAIGTLLNNDATLNADIASAETAISGKINTSAIANNLTTTSVGYVLDARQGKALNDYIGVLSQLKTSNKASAVTAINELYDMFKVDSETRTSFSIGNGSPFVNKTLPAGTYVMIGSVKGSYPYASFYVGSYLGIMFQYSGSYKFTITTSKVCGLVQATGTTQSYDFASCLFIKVG